MRRTTVLVLTAFVLVAHLSARAQAPATARGQAAAPSRGTSAAQPAASAASPLLWKIGTPTPSYLFGTIHVPDERVLALPATVSQALRDADAVFTEIPMDVSTQGAILTKVLLPSGQTLQDVIGTPLAERMAQAIARAVPGSAPPGTAGLLTTLLGRMKPWAAMSQLSLIEFLPDLMAGRQPLDGMLWTRAQEAGKEVAALETADEQLAVFEQFSLDEQKRLLELTLDAMDQDRRRSKTMAQTLIDAYLTGNLDALMGVMKDTMKGDEALVARFSAVALDQRNKLMAQRIRESMASRPGKVCFFAVGAAHYAGPNSVIALLEQASVPVERMR